MLSSNTHSGLSDKEDLIQSLLEGIKKKDNDSIREFFEILSDDIFNFPIRYNNFDEDEAADFYLYAFEHLKNGKKISTFQGKSKFTTWFFSVLRNLVIDFLRTRRHKLQISSLTNISSDGSEYDLLQNIPEETHTVSEYEEELINNFNKYLKELPINQRILLKLAYIHYFDFIKEEIDWLCELNNQTLEYVLKELSRLKNTALIKANEIKSIEDKLTSNFMSMDNIAIKINRFYSEHPDIEKNETLWSENYVSQEIPEEILQLIQSLSKKRNRHIQLIQAQQKSLLSTRIPYKEFSGLLKSSEGVLSVQLSRLLKKINDEL